MMINTQCTSCGAVYIEGFLNECEVLTAKYLTEIFGMDQVNATRQGSY